MHINSHNVPYSFHPRGPLYGGQKRQPRDVWFCGVKSPVQFTGNILPPKDIWIWINIFIYIYIYIYINKQYLTSIEIWFFIAIKKNSNKHIYINIYIHTLFNVHEHSYIYIHVQYLPSIEIWFSIAIKKICE
jgi:hypothetical protein